MSDIQEPDNSGKVVRGVFGDGHLVSNPLFPDFNPPYLPLPATWTQMCVWLLGVLDMDDIRTRRFVASVYSYMLENGYVTQGQREALTRICKKTMRRWQDKDLICQGTATPAQEEAILIEAEPPLTTEAD